MLEAHNRIFSGERTALAYSCKFLRDLPHDTSASEALLPYRVNRPLSFAKYNASRSKDTRFIRDNGILINFNRRDLAGREVRYSSELTWVASFFLSHLSCFSVARRKTLSLLSFFYRCDTSVMRRVHPLLSLPSGINFYVFPGRRLYLAHRIKFPTETFARGKLHAENLAYRWHVVRERV